MEQKVQPAPLAPHLFEKSLQLAGFPYIAGRRPFDTKPIRYRKRPGLRFLVEIGRGDAGSALTERLGAASGNAAFVGNAHDKPSLPTKIDKG